MNERKNQRLAHAGMAASVVASLGASICCIGPVVAAMFGVTSLAALAKYEPLRPFFATVTFAFLATSFYMTYRRQPSAECEPDSVCATHGVERIQRLNRIILWIVAAIALVVLTFPTWSGWILV